MSGDELRITHVIRAKPPGELGGADLHVVDLASAQQSRGHRVLVICLGPAEVNGALRDRRVPHLEIGSMSTLRWMHALGSELRSDPPDVLHTHGYRADIISTFIAPFIRGEPRWISAMTVHGFIRTTFGLRALSQVNEYALRRADLVIAVSSAESQRLASLLGRPVLCVPNGVAQASLRPRPEAMAQLGCRPSARVVAFVGRLSPEKRPDLFFDMAGIVARDHGLADFALIGSGPMMSDLRARSAADPGARVRLIGLLPSAASLMGAIDVLVCPSDSEGTPRAVIEAMLAGVPVVATRVGGVPDLLADRQTGLLVDPGSAPALAAAVAALLRHPAEARSLGDRAKEYAVQQLSAWQMEARIGLAYRSHLADCARARAPRVIEPGRRSRREPGTAAPGATDWHRP